MAVFGENESESSRSVAPGGYVPAREKSILNRFDSVVTVPTVDRERSRSPSLLQRNGGREARDVVDLRRSGG